MINNVITGSNRSLFLDLQVFYRVKSVSLFRFTRFLQGQISLPFSFYMVKSLSLSEFTRCLLQGQIGLSFSLYRVFTGSNQTPFSVYNVIIGSNWSLFFDLQGFYRVKSVSLFRITMLLQG